MKNCVVNISNFIASLVNAAELGSFTHGNTTTRLLDVNITVSDSQSKIINAGLHACLKTSSKEVNIEHSIFALKRCSQEIENRGTDATMSIGENKFMGKDVLVRLDGIKSCIANFGEGAQNIAESASNQVDTTNNEETLEFSHSKQVDTTNGEETLEFSEASSIPNEETQYNLNTFCCLLYKISKCALDYMWYLLLLAVFICFLFSAINFLISINARPASYFVLILWSIWILRVQVSYNETEMCRIIGDLSTSIQTMNRINKDWWVDFILFGYHIAICASSFIMLYTYSITNTSILFWLPIGAYLLYILQMPPTNQYLIIRNYLFNVSSNQYAMR